MGRSEGERKEEKRRRKEERRKGGREEERISLEVVSVSSPDWL